MSKPEIIDASELESGDRYFPIVGECVGQVVTADGPKPVHDDVTIVRVSRAPWPDEDLVYLIKATEDNKAVEPWTLAAKGGAYYFDSQEMRHGYTIVGTSNTLAPGYLGDTITEWKAVEAVPKGPLVALRDELAAWMTDPRPVANAASDLVSATDTHH